MELRPRFAAPLAADLALVAVVSAARLKLAVDPCDDAFLLLAVVRNALSGVGPHLAPDGADAVLSTLLWPLAVAFAAALGARPTAALWGLGWAAEIAAALAVRRLGTAATGSPAASALAAGLLATHPVLLLPSLGGMETALVIALLAAAATAFARERPAALALFAGALPWARFDAALAGALFLGAGLAAPWGRSLRARRVLAVGALAAAAAFAIHRVAFGLWLPTSITAKLATGAGGAAGMAAVALGFLESTVGRSAYWLVQPTPHLLLMPLALVGLGRLVRERDVARRLAPLLVWALAYVAIFVLAGREYARNFPWYFAPPLLALAALAAAGAAPAARALGRRSGRIEPIAAAAAALLVWLAVAPALERGFARVRASFTAHRERAYAAAALWLGRHGPARSVASNEIGALAWFSPPGTEIVDLFGLARRADERALTALELVRRRRPEAILSRADFRYRREVEAAHGGKWVWLRFGALDLGLEPALAARLEPQREELAAIYADLDLARMPSWTGSLEDPARAGRAAPID